jgi:hypothetical protein
MGGRFGKYGDLKRKAALRRSRREKGRLQKVNSPKPRYRAKKRKRNFSRVEANMGLGLNTKIRFQRIAQSTRP